MLLVYSLIAYLSIIEIRCSLQLLSLEQLRSIQIDLKLAKQGRCRSPNLKELPNHCGFSAPFHALMSSLPRMSILSFSSGRTVISFVVSCAGAVLPCVSFVIHRFCIPALRIIVISLHPGINASLVPLRTLFLCSTCLRSRFCHVTHSLVPGKDSLRFLPSTHGPALGLTDGPFHGTTPSPGVS